MKDLVRVSEAWTLNQLQMSCEHIGLELRPKTSETISSVYKMMEDCSVKWWKRSVRTNEQQVVLRRCLFRWLDGLVVSALDQWPRGHGFESAASCRVATVGQLLFAPWAWAYSTLHPLGVAK